jgi:hypothetical protein
VVFPPGPAPACREVLVDSSAFRDGGTHAFVP